MIDRRPLAVRSQQWSHRLAKWLADIGMTPNQVSVLSIVFAALGAACILWGESASAFVLAAACIQLRLICNLIDGLLAVEGGKKTPVGELYNEFPDRVSDTLLIVALGYRCGHPGWGWFAALLAFATAYVRVFGGAAGLAQDFSGPMAKQQRMFVMTIACMAFAVELHATRTAWSLLIALAVIVLGSAFTCVRRTARIAAQLREGKAQR